MNNIRTLIFKNINHQKPISEILEISITKVYGKILIEKNEEYESERNIRLYGYSECGEF